MPAATARTAAAAAAALAAALLAGCSGGAPEITATGATVRVPSNPGVTAGYLTVENTGGADDILTGVATDAAEEVQMHATVEEDGTTSMEQRYEVPVRAGESVEFASGGMHLMLMEPDGLEAGDTVRLTLSFAESGDVTVDAEVEDVMGGTGGGGMEDMDHSGHGG
ncbi:copper chaperone PCu(A)C [Nocardiopsis sp. CNT-189]|uniref:copper chaperone PCu(A)C n=1 Tax=Nocardiopsis oceanisediminis TaxID=2816862 RepID=UPI003B35EF6B